LLSLLADAAHLAREPAELSARFTDLLAHTREIDLLGHRNTQYLAFAGKRFTAEQDSAGYAYCRAQQGRERLAPDVILLRIRLGSGAIAALGSSAIAGLGSSRIAALGSSRGAALGSSSIAALGSSSIAALALSRAALRGAT